MLWAAAPSSLSLVRPAILRALPSTPAVPLRRAGLVAACPPARSLGSAASGADPRLAIHVAARCRAVSSWGSRGTRAVATMAKKSVGDLTAADLEGKRVLLRADLNVPLDDRQNITDDTRIRAAIPTIKHLISNGAKIILCSHLGRPKGVTPRFSLAPIVPRLSKLLGIQVQKADDVIGQEVEKMVSELPNGSVLLLENELDYLVGAISNPKRPLAAIVGGSKVSSKIGVIESLLEKCDTLFLGGGMIFTFYKAQGLSVGTSLVEDDKLELAASLLAKAKEKGVSIMLPTDIVIADKFAADASTQVVPASTIPDGCMGLDIGPNSISAFSSALETTQTVIWNGPMGVFEFDKFAVGTEAIAKKLAELSGKGVTTIIGGGDSVAAVEKVGVADVMSHISTGGGASLELLEGKGAPGSSCTGRSLVTVFLGIILTFLPCSVHLSRLVEVGVLYEFPQ
ncbi:hypothetical protein PR202_ga09358 [Eleusine coracana subsp. coracana]|uniref:Phosphoglycerate kinase n=1 Tax=Eleusine coracana subsp. coracana TaxID=191504 RepID=A0AAV5C3T2_ELECO|nr:hypothetical protein PR202_ga09358 [Eleusine coracana subsp. coracana]